MKIHIFEDEVDGKQAVVIAKDESEAETLLKKSTALGIKLLKSISLDEIKSAIILSNNKLPF